MFSVQRANGLMNKMAEKGRPESVETRGCWRIFTRFVGGFWGTREMQRTESSIDRELYAKTTVRELILYIFFLTILCIITFGMTSPTQFYYSDILRNVFTRQSNVTTVESMWKYLEGNFLDAVYWEYNYNDGEAQNFICPGGEGSAGPCPVAPLDKNVLYENRLLGVPRLRQLRVKNGSCEIHDIMQNFITNCYGEYESKKLDKEMFNDSILALNHTDRSAWRFQSGESLDVLKTSGKFAKYSGGGGIQDLSSWRNKSLEILKELKEGLWISHGTRLVIVDLSLYNANLNLFCIITISFERPASGGVFMSSRFHAAKLLRYVTGFDYFVLACEIVYLIFILYYIVEEIIEMRINGFSYFSNVWNMLDITVIVVSLINLAMIVYSSLVLESRLDIILAKPDEFADLTFLGSVATQTDNILALTIFFSWIKLLKYITFNKTMNLLTKTLQRSSGELLAFGAFFSIAFVAFALTGCMLFGPHIEEFSTFTDSVFTLLRIILGDFNFPAMKAVEPFLGPVYFTSYVLMVFFVLINMFLAIINDTYCEVKAELALQKLPYDLTDYFERGYSNIKHRLGGNRDRIMDIEHALKLAGADGSITYDELRQHLKRANFSDLEIEMFFSKYDRDGTEEINIDEANDILEDLSDREDDFEETQYDIGHDESNDIMEQSDHIVTEEDIARATQRVDELEELMGSLVDKLDGVMQKMDYMEKNRSEKREKMDMIFDPTRRDSSLEALVLEHDKL